MRLHAIKLTNFRQFSGEQSFELRSDSLKPVSLLFGANGAGKTTLLNAFTWALYGQMSDDVEEQDRMVTDTVWRSLPIGDTTQVAVELAFDHEGHNYRLLRRADVRKLSDEQQRPSPGVQLWETRTDGSSEMVGAPQERIYSILPRGVSRFFFFNGERIEKLVQKGAYSEVQHDIKALLDLEHVERAIAHLPKVDRRLTADLKKYGGEKASAIQTAIDDLRERESSARDELRVLEDALATLNEERESVTELLRQHASVAPIQKQRDAVQTELDEARAALKLAQGERASLVASRGFLAFTNELATATSAMAATLYQKGALPAPLKREFVDQLIEDGRCICGTPLAEHGDALRNVRDWRQRAGLQAVETAWQQLSGQMAPLSGARLELQESLQTIIKRISTERDRVARLEEQMSELDGQLKDSRLEDVQQLENKRLDLDSRIGVKRERIGSVKSSLEQTQKDIVQKTTERSKAEVTDELAAKARARSDLVQSVRRALEEILAIRSEDMRKRLDAELKSVFGQITIKRYMPRLSEGFELTLYQDVDGVELPVPKSTGENQILSLSFVAAVSKLARQIRKERRAEGHLSEDGGTYPIVMDAAFGSLDQNYQREVSRALAQMAPQLVVLVSKSQGLGHVVGELMPYVNHLGVIVTHTTAKGDLSDDIELDGIAYPYIRSSADADRAELKVIK
ncbi:AAA family ATPase [Micromonospora sp. NPDC050686]|uniref:AAA family ATPase n=1 Tax=Micromonospora sp. NPDC050686 TaxID=3154631 RepID=UPI00340B14AF